MKKLQKTRFLVQTLGLILTGISFFINFSGTLLAILVLTFFIGAFYCGWLCPFGFIQDLFSRIGSLLKIKKRKIPKQLHNILKYSRFILFIAVSLLSFDLIFTILSFDPRANFNILLTSHSLSLIAIIFISFFSLISMFYERIFCNYLCIEGAKYGVFGFLRPITIKRNENSCVNCKKCNKVCPMNIDVSNCSNLRSANCINCFECISACPVDNTLSYGIMNMNKLIKKLYFSLITLAGIAIITGLILHNIEAESSEILSNNIEINSKNNQENFIEKQEEQHENFNNNINHIKNQENGNGNRKGKHHSIHADPKMIIGSTVTVNGVNDGIYTGKAKGFRGNTKVSVTVSNGKIVDIEILDYRDDKKWFQRAVNVIPDSIIKAQSTDVDLVAGATYSSAGIRNAVAEALKNAK